MRMPIKQAIRKTGFLWSFSLLINFLASFALYANPTLSASVDRTLIEQGDILQLTLTANFQTTTRGPDLSLLRQDFDVLGSQASSQLRVINGQFTATTSWDIQMIPKRLGTLIIPAFQVEQAQSQPIQIEVSPASQPQADFRLSFLEAQVDNLTPYVQSQVIFTLRFYHLGSLVRGNIDPPQFDQALSERLQNQNTFERRVQGRVYRVYEWVYALHPLSSGELIIPPQQFEGTLLHDRQLRMIQLESEPIRLQVKPIPSTYPNGVAWLPAKKLELQEEWQVDPELKVGGTLNRRISLQANGLRASQLPEPYWPSHPALRQYQDPVSQNEHLAGLGISSIKSQDFMAVTLQEGEILLPEIEIPWWNTQTDQLEIARLPEKRIQVQPAALANLANISVQPLAPESASSSNYWLYLSLLFAWLWIVTLILFWRFKHTTPKPSTEPKSEVQVTPLPMVDAQQSEAQFYEQVKHQLKRDFGIENRQRLQALHPDLAERLNQLEQRLYAPQTRAEPIDQQAIWKMLQSLPKPIAQTDRHHLIGLYPSK